jgi:hypothetical protein
MLRKNYLLVLNSIIFVVTMFVLFIDLYMGRKNRKSRKPQREKRQEVNNIKFNAEYEARKRHPSNHKRSEQGYKELAVKTYELWDD